MTYTATDAKGNKATCTFTVAVAAAQCASTFSTTKCYRIVNVNSGKVLDVEGNQTCNNTPIIQWPYNGGSNQQVRLYPLGNNYFKIMFRNSGRVLACHSTADYSDCYLYTYYTGGYKDWKIECNADGSYKITHRASGKALSVELNSLDNGADLEIRPWNGSASQKWRIEEVACNTSSTLLSENTLLTMDADAEANRTRIDWITNTGFKNDYFNIQKMNADGEFIDIATVNANVADDDLQNFTAYDDNPTEGDNFYRIKATYNDGKTAFSETRKVSYSQLSDVRIFPNPANEVVNIDLKKYQGQSVNIFIYNQLGKPVKTVKLEEVRMPTHEMDIQELVTGSYLIRIQSSGKRDVTKQLFIGK